MSAALAVPGPVVVAHLHGAPGGDASPEHRTGPDPDLDPFVHGHDAGHGDDDVSTVPIGLPHTHGVAHSHGLGRSHVHALPEGVERVGWRSVVVPGIAGGLVPSPAAMLVFLGGIALGRAWFGLLLVLAYGMGIGLSLVGAGYLLVLARGAIERRLGSSGLQRALRVASALPVLTAVLVIGGGLLLAVRSLVA